MSRKNSAELMTVWDVTDVMQELRLSIKRMLDKLFPWHCGLLTASNDDCVTTSQLIETIDALICEDVTGDGQTQVILCNLVNCNSVYLLYTVFRKNVVHLIFGHNLFKYRSIFRILSLTDSWWNCLCTVIDNTEVLLLPEKMYLFYTKLSKT